MSKDEAIERLAAALAYYRTSGKLATRANTQRIAERFMVHPVTLRKALRMEAENEKDKTMSDHETKPTADKPLSFACSECEFTTDDPVDGLMNHWDAAQHPDPEDELPYTYLSMTYKGVVIFGRIEHERETRAMREKFKTDFWANGVSKQVTDYDLLRFETNAENWSTPVCVPHSAASRDLLRDVLTSYLGKLYEEKANVEKYGMPGQSGDTRKEIKRVEKLLEMD